MTVPPAPVVPAAAANPLLEAALHLAALGYRVFPCHSPAPGGGCTCGKRTCGKPGKHPRNRNGCNGATTNPAQIRKWWAKWSDANIGVATAGLLVVDTDGPEGEAAIAERDLPTAPTATTGKGTHRFFVDTTGAAKCKVGVLPQVDIRAAGGYVIAAPSVHPSGAVYAWAPGLSPDDLTPPPAPQWLYDLAAPRGDIPPPAPPEEAPSTIPTGRRNDTLARLAGGLRADGLELAAITSELLATNKARCSPPLPEGEVRSIAASIVRYAAAPNGPTVRVSRRLLKLGLTDGALALYATRQAILQATGAHPKQVAQAQALGVGLRSVKQWTAELRAADLDKYERPSRRYVAAPVGLLTDPDVPHEAKVTALWLLTFADIEGAATVGLEALAKVRGLCPRSVKYHQQVLRETGHLLAYVAPYNAELGRRERCNRYRLLATAPPAAVGLTPQKVQQVAHSAAAGSEKVQYIAPESRPLGGEGEEAVQAVSEKAQQARSERAVSAKAADLRSGIVDTPVPAPKTAAATPWRPRARRPIFAPAIPRLSDAIQAEGEKLAAAAGLQAAMVIAMIHRHGLAKVQGELQAISGGRRSRKKGITA